MDAKLRVSRTNESKRRGPLGSAVHRTRRKAGLTISELARRAGVGRKFLRELEGGKSTLRADKVLSVLSALGLELTLLPARGNVSGDAKQWLKRNRAAIAAYNNHVEEHGVFSEGLRSF